MRNKIATLLLAFAIFLPCAFLFTACGNDDNQSNAKATSMSIELTSTTYQLIDNAITVEYGSKIELDSTDFKITVTFDNGETKEISQQTASQAGYSFTSTIPADAITPVGDCTITITYGELKNIVVNVSVTKATIDMSAVRWDYSNAFTYDGDIKQVKLDETTLPNGVSVSYQGNTATKADTYVATAIFTYSDTDNYNSIPNKTLNWEIVPASIDVSAVAWSSTKTFTYSGAEFALKVIDLPANVTATYTYSQGQNVVASPKDAGTYTAHVVLTASSSNYKLINNNGIADTTYTIEQAEIDLTNVEWDDQSSYVYNGSAVKPELKLNTIPTNVSATYSYKVKGGDAIENPTNVGTYVASVTLTSTSANYVIEETIADFEFTITPAKISLASVAWVGEDEVTYSGTAVRPELNTIPANVNHVYSYRVKDGDAIENPTNVGTYVASVTLTPASTNYVIEGTIADFEFTITPAKISLASVAWVGEEEVTYSGTVVRPELNTIPTNASATYSYKVKDGDTVENPTNVGTYVASVTLTSTSANYVIEGTIADFEFTITPAKISLASVAWVGEEEVTYSGTAVRPELNEIPANVNHVYSYREKGGDAIENPTNVGTYVASVALTSASANYVIEGTIADFEFTITQAEIDLIDVEWDYEAPYTYTGEAFEPKLKNVPNLIEDVDYVYSGDHTNVGLYTASATFIYDETNCVLVNDSISGDYFEYRIMHAEIDMSGVEWSAEYSAQIPYTGEAIKPILNKEIANLTYTYKYEQEQEVEVDGGVQTQWVEVNPVEMGLYQATVTLVYDQVNYILTNNELSLSVMYYISQAVLDISSLSWNIDADIDFDGGYSKDYSATLEYSGNAQEIEIIGDEDVLNKLEIKYSIEGSEATLDVPTVTDAKTYLINAYVRINEAFSERYCLDSDCAYYNLSLEVVRNPFASILINGEGYTFDRLINTYHYEYGTTFAFTVKEGYTLKIVNNNTQEPLVDNEGQPVSSFTLNDMDNMSYKVIVETAGETPEHVYEAEIEGYVIDKITVGDNETEYVTSGGIWLQLTQDQTSITIGFDDIYLTKYDFSYRIYHVDKTETNANLTSLPLIINELTNVESITIYMGEYVEPTPGQDGEPTSDTRRQIFSISIEQYSPVSYYMFKYQSMDSKTEGTGSTSSILYNSIITGIYAVGHNEEQYTDVRAYTDYECTELVDWTNIESYISQPIYVKAFDESGNLLDETSVNANYNFYTPNDVGFDVSKYSKPSFKVGNDNSFAMTFEYENSNFTDVSATFKLSGAETFAESITLTNVLTSATLRLEIKYNDATYYYETEIEILKSIMVTECADLEQGAPHFIDAENGRKDINWDNSIWLDKYNVTNINSFKPVLDTWTFVSATGYSVSEQTLTRLGSNYYIAITLDHTVEETTTAKYLYIKLNIDGEYNNDTSGTIYINDMATDEVIYFVKDETNTFDNPSMQELYVQLNNRYAVAQVFAKANTEIALITSNEWGYFSYQFASAGEYILKITATDGTIETYQIVVEESDPLLEIVVGDKVLSILSPDDPNADFEMDDYGTEITGYLGEYPAGTEKITITSARSSMLEGASICRDQEGLDVIDTSKAFDLPVVNNTTPYVAMYCFVEVQGQRHMTVIYLYLTEKPGELMFQVKYGETVLSEYQRQVGDDVEIYGSFTEVFDEETGTGYYWANLNVTLAEDATTLTLDELTLPPVPFDVTDAFNSSSIISSKTNVTLKIGEHGSKKAVGISMGGYATIYIYLIEGEPAPEITIINVVKVVHGGVELTLSNSESGELVANGFLMTTDDSGDTEIVSIAGYLGIVAGEGVGEVGAPFMLESMDTPFTGNDNVIDGSGTIVDNFQDIEFLVETDDDVVYYVVFKISISIEEWAQATGETIKKPRDIMVKLYLCDAE